MGGCGVGGCGIGGAGARLFFFCRSIWDPRDTWEAQRKATVSVRAALLGSGVHVGCTAQRLVCGTLADCQVPFWGPRAGGGYPGMRVCHVAQEWPQGGSRMLTDILRPL